MNILTIIQSKLNAPKNQRNNFGNYNYRSCEDILVGLKPLLAETESSVILSDDIKMIGDRIYVVATAKLVKDTKVIAEATAFAREPLQQKGMNEAQITGSASSYARKYALNGLFAIDDNKDADTNEYKNNSDKNPNNQKPSIKDQIEKYLTCGVMPNHDIQIARQGLSDRKLSYNKSMLDRLISTYGAI